jgi:hypothetical protein
MHRRSFVKQLSMLAGASQLPAASSPQPPPPPPAPAPDGSPIDFGSRKQVFVDWWFVEAGYGLAFTPREQKERKYQPRFMPRGVKLRTITPLIQPTPILVPDTPADGILVGAYATLMKDGGKYRLWYEGWRNLDDPNDICYAESDDGHEWRKPALGLVEFAGSKRNNIVYQRGHGATIFKDPSAPAAECYKLLHVGPAPKGQRPQDWVFGAVSPDGLRWTRLEQPIMKQVSDTQSVALYDAELGKYVAYVRGWDPQAPSGYGARRVVRRTESSDFRNFPPPTIVLRTGPADGPDTDIYTNAYQRWPGAARAHIMLPAFYHRATDVVDVHLAVSRDGLRWDRPSTEPLIGVGTQGSGLEGSVYAAVGTVPLASGQWAFPIWRSALTHNMVYREYFKHEREGALWLATLREDGFMALEAETEGECWTQQATFQGSRLTVNSWSHLGGRLRVELFADGKVVPGFALDDCDGVEGDALWKPVSWKGRTDVSALAGKTMRVRFHLTRCRLHAFRFC